MSTKETLSNTSLSTLSSSNADSRLSVMVLRSLFLMSAILLKERSPEQFETIKHMKMRNAIHLEMSSADHACELTSPYQLVLNILWIL